MLALVVLLAVAYVPLGDYMARVFTAEKHWRVETLVYRVVRVDPASGQRWTTYAAGVLGFSFFSIVLLYLLQRLQPLLPLSFGRGAVPPGMAFNNAVSFTTNTNWQSYVPEQVMGDTVQMAGFTVQNVMSAAVGLAVAVALIRGILGDRAERLGNFWVDLTRGAVRILLPLSFVAGDPAGGGRRRDVAEVRLRRHHRRRHAVHDPARARRARRRRSRSWGRTAAGSSTPTPRTPSRTRTRSRTSSRSSCCW